MGLTHKVGEFHIENKEFLVKGANHKKLQDNFIFNKNVFSYVTHTGSGYFAHIDKDDYATRVVTGRLIYIKDNDSGELWSVGYEPIFKQYEEYNAVIGLNYTTITNKTNGVKCTWTIFVPDNDTQAEMWNVDITSDEDRNITVFLFVELAMASSYPTYGDYMYCRALYDQELNRIQLISKAPILIDKINAVTSVINRKPDSFTCSEADFIGNYRTFCNPATIDDGQLPNTNASGEIPCAAYSFNLNLKSGIKENIVNVIGVHNRNDDIQYLTTMTKDFEKLMMETKSKINNKFDSFSINTGIEEIDNITNIWGKQMVSFGATHCRWGVKGFRDIVQHTMGYSYLEPNVVKETLIKCLKHQKSNGFAVRSFPLIHADSNMRYNDSSTWLVFAITDYIKESGDLDFLNMNIEFLDGESATVLERLDLIVTSVFNDRGERGLVRMWGGDWNDSFTHVGPKGLGESIWLSMFNAKSILLVDELYKYIGKPNPKYIEMYEETKQAINKNAWDGNWYIRAINDAGEKIGASENKEGRIYLNAQSWAMISEIADEERLDSMINSIKENLKTEYGYILHTPAYQDLDPNIGRVSAVEPGTIENAPSYTHGNAFLIYGLLTAGKSDDALEVLKLINPMNKFLEDKGIVPYVYANSYYGPECMKKAGSMEHSWITGSINWITEAIIEKMFGVERCYDGLRFKPNLPKEIKHAKMNRKYRGGEYDITIINNGKNVKCITVNGNLIDKSQALVEQGKVVVEIVTE